MKYSLLVSLCFLPLVIIFIITKISLWMSSSAKEVTYVREESRKPHGPYLDGVYEDLDAEEEADGSW